MGRFPQDLRPAGRLHRQITVCPFDPLGPVLPGSFGLSAPFSSSCLLGPFGLLRQKFVVCISGSPYRTVAVKQTVVFRPPLMGRCRNAKSGAVCRQRASRQATQRAARGARPYLQDELVRKASLRGSEFVNESLTQHISGLFFQLSEWHRPSDKDQAHACLSESFQTGLPHPSPQSRNRSPSTSNARENSNSALLLAFTKGEDSSWQEPSLINHLTN